MAYWTAFFPADVVKSRLQTDAALSGKSFGDVFLHLLRTEGFKALYKVCVSRVHDVWMSEIGSPGVCVRTRAHMRM